MKKTPTIQRESLLGTALRTTTAYVPAACAAVIVASSSLNAQTISVNLGSDDQGVGGTAEIDTTGGANPAGAISVGGEFWNNAPGANGSLADGTVIDETGAVVPGFAVDWTSNNTWRSASTGATATSENGALTKGYLDDGGVTADVTITSPFLLQDVYVIVASGQGNPYGSTPFGVGGTLYKGDGAGGTTIAANGSDVWTAGGFEEGDTLVEGTNYLLIEDQPTASIDGLARSGNNRGSIAGFQIVNSYTGTLSFWDANGATPGSGDLADGDLDGTWGIDANWSSDSTGSSATGAWTPGNAAVFSAGDDGVGTHTITVDGTQSADAIWVQEGDITLSGGNIDLSSGIGLIRNSGAGILAIDSQLTGVDVDVLGDVDLNNASNSISGNLGVLGNVLLNSDLTVGTLGGAGTLDIGSFALTVGNANDGSFAGALNGGIGSSLTKDGTGTQSIGSALGTIDDVTINDGTLALGADGTASWTLDGSGVLQKSGGGGYLTVESTANPFTGQWLISSGRLRIAEDTSLGAVPGAFTADSIVLENGARIQGGTGAAGADVLINANRGITLNSGNAGFHTWTGFTMTVDAPIANGTLDDGDGGFIAATLTKSDGGTLILNGGSSHTGDTRLEGGILDLRSTISVPSPNTRMTGTSQLLLADAAGEHNTERLVTSDGYAAKSTINQSDGVLNITGTNNANNTGASFLMGHWGGGSVSAYNLSGGTLNSLGAELSLGWDSSNVNFNQTGGEANLLGVDLGNGRNNAASYNLDGGTLNLGANGITTNGNKTVNLGGGTLGSLDSWSSGQNLVLTSTVGDSSIAPGAGHIINLTGGLSGAGGFSKDGAGTLVLGGAGTYAGNTVINDGETYLSDGATGASPVTVTGGSIRPGTLAATESALLQNLDLQDGSGSTFRLDFVNPDQFVVVDTDGLTTAGTHSITAIPTGELFVGDTFPVIDYDGTIQGAGFGAFSINPLPNPHIGVALVDNALDTTVDLEVTAIDTLTWSGAVDGNWDVNSTGNWLLDSDGVSSSNFYDYDGVSFEDGSGNTNLTLTGPIITSAVTFLNDVDTFTLGGDGITSGSLTLDGFGTVVLTNDNTYGGNTTINAGVLQIGDGTNGSISTLSSVVVGAGAELALNPAAGSSFTNSTTNDGTVRLLGVNDSSITGISGSGDIVIDNTGTTTLPGSGYTGNFILNGGTTLATGGAWAASLFGNGTRSVTINTGAVLQQTAAHDLGGLGAALYEPAITVNDGGTWLLDAEQYLNGNNLTLSGGEVVINNGKDLRLRGGTTTVSATAGGSVFRTDSTGSVRLFANSTFDVDDGAAVDDLTVDVPIDQSGTRGMTKTGAGNMLANQPINAGATVAVAGGTLTLGAASSVPNATVIQVDAGAELDATAASPLAIGAAQSLVGNGTLDGSATVTGTIAPGASAGALTVTGDVELGESSTYNWEVADWTGAAGTGFDTLVADSITFTSTVLNRFTVVITEDALLNFSEADTSFVIASTTSGITGFDPGAVVVDSTAFTTGAGSWALAVDGNDLVLEYTGLADPYLAYETANNIGGAGADVDSDGDGVDNGIEFVIGGVSDPGIGQSDLDKLPTSSFVNADPDADTNFEDYLLFTYRRTDESADSNPYAQYSTTLGSWTEAEGGVDGVVILETDDGFDTGVDQVDVYIPASLAVDGKLFGRLRVDIP